MGLYTDVTSNLNSNTTYQMYGKGAWGLELLFRHLGSSLPLVWKSDFDNGRRGSSFIISLLIPVTLGARHLMITSSKLKVI